MIKSKSLLFFFVLLIPFLSINSGEPSPEEISKLNFNDLKTLGKYASDPQGRPRFKILVMERLNIVLIENMNQLESKGREILTILGELFQSSPDSGSSYNSIIRKKTCFMLGYLKKTSFRDEAYTKLHNQIISETSGDVAGTCITVISDFEERKDQTTKLLIGIIHTELKKKRVDEEDTELMLSVIEALGIFKSKSSYIPLMKLLDSKYSIEVKNNAKEVLESIPQ